MEAAARNGQRVSKAEPSAGSPRNAGKKGSFRAETRSRTGGWLLARPGLPRCLDCAGPLGLQTDFSESDDVRKRDGARGGFAARSPPQLSFGKAPSALCRMDFAASPEDHRRFRDPDSCFRTLRCLAFFYQPRPQRFYLSVSPMAATGAGL